MEYLQTRNIPGRMLVYRGEKAPDAATRLGLMKQTVTKRVREQGWSLEDAFSRKRHERPATTQSYEQKLILKDNKIYTKQGIFVGELDTTENNATIPVCNPPSNQNQELLLDW